MAVTDKRSYDNSNRVIARCNHRERNDKGRRVRCKGAKSFTVREVGEIVTTELPSGGFPRRHRRVASRTIVETGQVLPPNAGLSRLIGPCSVCGETYWEIMHIQGSHDPDKKCDGRCMSARGPICECSCGGANHGANHSILVGLSRPQDRDVLSSSGQVELTEEER